MPWSPVRAARSEDRNRRNGKAGYAAHSRRTHDKQERAGALPRPLARVEVLEDGR
jgi:hypothetical protein